MYADVEAQIKISQLYLNCMAKLWVQKRMKLSLNQLWQDEEAQMQWMLWYLECWSKLMC